MVDWNNVSVEETMANCIACKQVQCNHECPWLTHYNNLTPKQKLEVNDKAFGRKDGKSNN